MYLYCRELSERVALNLQLKSIAASRRSAAAGFKSMTVVRILEVISDTLQ